MRPVTYQRGGPSTFFVKGPHFWALGRRGRVWGTSLPSIFLYRVGGKPWVALPKNKLVHIPIHIHIPHSIETDTRRPAWNNTKTISPWKRFHNGTQNNTEHSAKQENKISVWKWTASLMLESHCRGIISEVVNTMVEWMFGKDFLFR